MQTTSDWMVKRTVVRDIQGTDLSLFKENWHEGKIVINCPRTSYIHDQPDAVCRIWQSELQSDSVWLTGYVIPILSCSAHLPSISAVHMQQQLSCSLSSCFRFHLSVQSCVTFLWEAHSFERVHPSDPGFHSYPRDWKGMETDRLGEVDRKKITEMG